jgi:superfamily I DNA/RNA helicase
MDNTQDTQNLQEILGQMQNLLALYGEKRWANSIHSFISRFASAHADEVQHIAREALQVYGGTGSLSDVVLYRKGKPLLKENDTLDDLRQRLHRELVHFISK